MINVMRQVVGRHLFFKHLFLWNQFPWGGEDVFRNYSWQIRMASRLTHVSLIPLYQINLLVPGTVERRTCILWWQHQWGLVNPSKNKQTAKPERRSSQDCIPSAWESRAEAQEQERLFYWCEVDHSAGVTGLHVCVLMHVTCAAGACILIMLTVHKGMEVRAFF